MNKYLVKVYVDTDGNIKGIERWFVDAISTEHIQSMPDLDEIHRITVQKDLTEGTYKGMDGNGNEYEYELKSYVIE